MEKITIKELVQYSRKTSERTKKNFSLKLKNREMKNPNETEKEEGGGDYWITSTSCIYNVFKYGNEELYDIKIDELHLKHKNSNDKRIQAMYQRNIDILTGFKEFNFNDTKPLVDLYFEKLPKVYKIITIKNFPIYVNPNLLFSYEIDGKKQLGALWLIPQLKGFTKFELGMFCEILYRSLIKNYSDSHQISEDYCIAIDTFNALKISYSDFSKENIPFLIDRTLSEIKD